MASQNLEILVQVKGTGAASAEIKGLAEATGQVGTATEQTSKKTSGLRKSLSGIATGLAAYKGYQFVKSAISTTESLAKSTAGLRRITGLDTQTAAGWVTVAKERGVQSKQLNMGFATLGRQMESAQKNSKSAGAAFTALGIPLDQVRKMNTQQAMNAVSDALAKMPPGAEKAAAAQKLFGRAGQGLLPILNSGSKALNEQVTAAGKASNMNGKTMQSSLKLAAQQRELNTAMLGLKVAIGSALIPILTQLATAFVPVITAFSQLMSKSPAFRMAIYALAAALTALKVAMFFGASLSTGGIIGGVVLLGVLLVQLYQKVGWFRNGVNAAFDFIKQHWQLLVAAIPVIGPIIVVVARNFTLLKNIAVGAFNFIRSVAVGAFHGIETAARAIVGVARGAFNGVVGAARAIVGGMAGAGRTAASAFTGAFRTVVGAVTSIVNTLKSLLSSVASTVSGALRGAFSGVLGVVRTIASAISTVANTAGKAASLISKAGSAASSIGGAVGSLSPFQAGGTVAPGGQMALVGERGPEIVALPGGANVIPNHQLGGVGGTVHTHVYLDRREIAHALGSYTADRQAAR